MTLENKKTVQVAVGVILRDNLYYLTKRLDHVHQGGKWEFPGGKVEAGETVAQALARELQEEVGIEILTCEPLQTITHDYGDKQVCLEVFIVEQFLNDPASQEGLEGRWFSFTDMKTLDFPEANNAIISALSTRD